jgi:hypothetical protein
MRKFWMFLKDGVRIIFIFVNSDQNFSTVYNIVCVLILSETNFPEHTHMHT